MEKEIISDNKNKFTRKIGIKIPEAYYHHLHAMAKKDAGKEKYSISNFVRPYLPDYDNKDLTHISRKKLDKVVYKEVSKDLLISLARIGNNVNQLARFVNRAVYYGNMNDIDYAKFMEQHEQILEELKRIENAG